MHPMRRAAGSAALILVLAACAAPGTGGGGTSSDTPSMGEAATSGSPSTAPQTDGDGAQRVDIGALTSDPGTFAGQEITVLARVDEVLVDGSAFVTSPSATEEGRLLVVVRPDGQVDKEPATGGMVLVDGTVVGFTPEDLQAAGIDLGREELGGFDGEFAFVADAVRDPLAEAGG